MSAPPTGQVAAATLAPVHTRPIGRAVIGDQLRRHARTQPDKLAFISYALDGTRSECSYGELDRRANRFAHALLGLGVGHGDRVAAMARNSIEIVAAYYGTLKIGAAFTGINVLYGAAEIRQQLEHATPAVVVAGTQFTALIDQLRNGLPDALSYVALDSTPDWLAFDDITAAASDTEPECDIDEHDLAMLVYTSGTEAAPKGVMIPHRNYLISTAPAWSWGVNTGPDDTWLFVMPFHTIAGLGSMTTLTLMGATLVLPATPDPGGSLEILEREHVTVIAQTPTFYLALCAHPNFAAADIAAVRRCMTYGGQVSPRAIDAWAAAAPDAVWGTYWGQSELSQLGTVGWFRTLADIPDADPTWIGKPVTHLEIRVVDPEGNDTHLGELCCRTPSVMLGYYKDPEHTARVLREGWVHTGDMVRIDAAGNLFFHDRLKDMIKSGGMNVSSQEVERVLHTHPTVQRAAVVAMPHPYWSEAVTAFVIPVPNTTPDPDEIIAFCRAHLAAYKVPKTVYLLDELPLDAQGKILKRELRTRPPTTQQPAERR